MMDLHIWFLSEWIHLDVVRRLTPAPSPAQTPTPAHTPKPSPASTPKAEEVKNVIDHIKASKLEKIGLSIIVVVAVVIFTLVTAAG
jgi:hypothetical protein